MDQQLRALAAEVFDVDPAAFGDDVDFRTLEGWDSLTHMELIAGVEQAFQIELTGDEIVEMMSVAAARKILERRGET